MTNRIARLRIAACARQESRCYYCGMMMCCGDARSFAQAHNITVKQARLRACTAEHLLAKSEGGKTSASNIVAACRYCNRARHARKKPKQPEAFRIFVARRIAKHMWHLGYCSGSKELKMDPRVAQG